MTKAKQSVRDEAIASLRETLKPGDTVHTVLRNVSRSGMSRDIDLYKIVDGETRWLSRLAAKACGFTFNEKRDCIKVGGCGMDMGFHLVYSLSRVLFHDQFECIGKGCPSNDHNNAYSASRQNQCFVCRGELPDKPKYTRADGDSFHAYPVCSQNCASKPWMHSDGGYALKHRWI